MQKIIWCDVSKAKEINVERINSLERRAYLGSVTDEKRKKQSFFVWLLLEYALKKYFSQENIEFHRLDSGKWKIKDSAVRFSLSHSEGVIAVGVSNVGEIGVDVEKVTNKILKVKKFLIAGESSELPIESEELKTYLTELWTKKESVCKCGEKPSFILRQRLKDATGNDFCLCAATVCGGVEIEEIKWEESLKCIL